MTLNSKWPLGPTVDSLDRLVGWLAPERAAAPTTAAGDDRLLYAPLELRGTDSAAVWSPQGEASGTGPTTPAAEPGDQRTPGADGPAPARASVARLPWSARVYVGGVMVLGAAVAVAGFPRVVPDPVLTLGLLTLVLFASVLKVQLPVLKTSATMSVSFVADFIAVMLLGPGQAMLIAGAGALAQCLVHRRDRRVLLHRVVFSVAALVVTVQATALVYGWLGGQPGQLDPHNMARPIVGGAFTYFLVNAALVALASALATRQSPWRVWHDAFLWSAPSYFVGAGVAAIAAWSIDRGEFASAVIMVAPVYLTYRTYQVYLGRIEDEQRHAAAVSALNRQAIRALDLARRSQRALAIEKERLAVTLGSIGEAVLASDTRGRVVLMNQTAETFTGWTQDEAAGVPVTDVFRLLDRETGKSCASPVDRVLRTREAVDRDSGSALMARDGTQRLVEHSATPVRDHDDEIVAVVVVARDTTDAARLEAERLRAGKLASLGVLAGGIAHDFNNILTAIVGNISLAQLEDCSTTQRGSLADAEKACVRAKALTHQLLTFSKGGAPLKKLVFLQETIREAASFALLGSNVRCDFDIAEDLWAVDADEGQISQVVNNLVLNAVQAMPLGGVIEVRAFNEAAGTGEALTERANIRVEVEDHGVGIPETHLPKIFDPYFTTKASGRGLGLATSYSIVSSHGGEIGVRSVVGRGTTMSVVLPAVVSASLRPGGGDGTAAVHHGRGHVLVMDDESAIRDVARAMLTRLGYRVDVAADGQEAIDRFLEAREAGDAFDTVIMDLTIPGGMGGKDAIKHLLALDPHVTAIVSSGYADDPVMAQYEEYGFKGVVPKPFTIAELSRLLQRLMA